MPERTACTSTSSSSSGPGTAVRALRARRSPVHITLAAAADPKAGRGEDRPLPRQPRARCAARPEPRELARRRRRRHPSHRRLLAQRDEPDLRLGRALARRDGVHALVRSGRRAARRAARPRAVTVRRGRRPPSDAALSHGALRDRGAALRRQGPQDVRSSRASGTRSRCGIGPAPCIPSRPTWAAGTPCFTARRRAQRASCRPSRRAACVASASSSCASRPRRRRGSSRSIGRCWRAPERRRRSGAI